MRHKNRSGFTILELTLYMGLLLILLAVISQLFTASLESQLASQTFSYTQQDGRYIMNRLTYDIQRATAVTTPSSLGGSSATLQMTVAGSTYTYSLTGQNLLLNGIRMNGFNTAISNLSFQKLGNTGGKPTIKFAYTVTSLTLKYGAAEVKNYQSTVGLR